MKRCENTTSDCTAVQGKRRVRVILFKCPSLGQIIVRGWNEGGGVLKTEAQPIKAIESEQ